MTAFFRTVTRVLPYLVASVLSAQPYDISTSAGGAPPVTPAVATSTSIGLPGGIAVDMADNVFFSARNCLFRLDRSGVLTRVAGNAKAGYSGDGGPAINAQLTSPNSIAVDNSGNLYIVDSYRVRMVSAAGIITTVAGNGTQGYAGDGGPALAAQIGSPEGIAVDGSGNIYLVDYFHGVRRISPVGIITTVAGNGTVGYSGDGGPAIGAQLNGSEAVAVDPAGNLYIADSSNYRVRKVSPDGIITTFAGNGTLGYSGDGGPAINAQIDRPDAIAFDRNGNLYIAASYNFRIRKVSPAGIVTTVYAGDVFPGTEGEAIGFGADSAGNVYASDDSRYRIRKISPDGTVTTAAGNGIFSYSGDGGPVYHAQVNGPQDVKLDAAGNLYIADTYNSVVRRVSPAGIITTVAGNGIYGNSGDGGAATSAEFRYPWALALDSAGNLYIADAAGDRIRRVSPNGIVTTVAGGDTGGYSGDGGPAISAQLNGPTALAVDSVGNLFIADSVNHRIRKISPAGIITTVAGNGTSGSSGTGGPATSAQLTDPSGVAVDNAGDLYIFDLAGFGRVSKVSPQGIITTLAGAGDVGGPPVSRQTPYPNALATDSLGNVYFTDAYNARVRKISPDGTIATIAGNGVPGYSGDGGPATLAQLYNPMGLVVDPAGKVYIADDIENAVRLLQPISSSVTVAAVTNGASDLSGPVSPGEIVVLYGSMLGPAALKLSQVNAAGSIATALAGTSVSFNGTPAPILYSSFTQVAAIVPYELSGPTAQVSLTWQGQTSPPVSVPLAPSAPALFTLDSSGQGQVAAINQDGSINSSAWPTPPGSVVSLYATGEGLLSPAGVDGQIAGQPLPQPVLPVTIILGGQTLIPEYAGSAAGEVEGLMQINVRIPPGIAGGSTVPVAVRVGGATSQAATTLVIGPG